MSARTQCITGLAVFLGLTGAVANEARAEFFFRPFGGVFAGKIEEEPPPAFTSREAVGRIVAREGYRLVGPLRRHGEQIIAVGVDRRGRRMRFVIDPYEGTVLSSQRLAEYAPDMEPVERAPRGRALPPEASAPPPGADDESPPSPRRRAPAGDTRERVAEPGAPQAGSTRRAIAPPKTSPRYDPDAAPLAYPADPGG